MNPRDPTMTVATPQIQNFHCYNTVIGTFLMNLLHKTFICTLIAAMSGMVPHDILEVFSIFQVLSNLDLILADELDKH